MLSDKGHVLEYLRSFNLFLAESAVTKKFVSDQIIFVRNQYYTTFASTSCSSWYGTYMAISGGVSKYSLLIYTSLDKLNASIHSVTNEPSSGEIASFLCNFVG